MGRLPGWRFAFLSVAALSFLIGAVTFWLGQEPCKQRGLTAAAISAREGGIKLGDIAGHMLSVMRVPTFGLLVAQVGVWLCISLVIKLPELACYDAAAA